MVLRAMPASDSRGGQTIVPSLSVTVAVIFGVATVLVILAYVNYIGHALRVGDLIDHIAGKTIAGMRRLPLHHVGSALPPVAQELLPVIIGTPQAPLFHHKMGYLIFF